jgi:hypothetical protein
VKGIDDGAARLRIDESFRGGLEGEIRLNDHAFWQAGGRCELTLDTFRYRYEDGTRLALFLVRDEFGVGEWRAAIWGTGIWEVNDSDLVRYPGIPLLSEVREAVREQVGPPPTPRAAPAETTPSAAATPGLEPGSVPDAGSGLAGDRSSLPWWAWIIGGGALLVAIVAAGGVALRRRAR